MPVRYGLEHFLTNPALQRDKFHHPFLVAGWTEMAALA
jgi:hypothetical protein